MNEAMPSDKVLAIRSLEALAKVANGKATKIIILRSFRIWAAWCPASKS